MTSVSFSVGRGDLLLAIDDGTLGVDEDDGLNDS